MSSYLPKNYFIGFPLIYHHKKNILTLNRRLEQRMHPSSWTVRPPSPRVIGSRKSVSLARLGCSVPAGRRAALVWLCGPPAAPVRSRAITGRRRTGERPVVGRLLTSARASPDPKPRAARVRDARQAVTADWSHSPHMLAAQGKMIAARLGEQQLQSGAVITYTLGKMFPFRDDHLFVQCQNSARDCCSYIYITHPRMYMLKDN